MEYKHVCNEHQESWMEGLLCTDEGCKNDARHDWVVSALCCAHDHVMNLYLVIDQKNAEIKSLDQALTCAEDSVSEWRGAWEDAVAEIRGIV